MKKYKYLQLTLVTFEVAHAVMDLSFMQFSALYDLFQCNVESGWAEQSPNLPGEIILQVKEVSLVFPMSSISVTRSSVQGK